MGVIVRWAYLTYNNILCFTKRCYYCYIKSRDAGGSRAVKFSTISVQ